MVSHQGGLSALYFLCVHVKLLKIKRVLTVLKKREVDPVLHVEEDRVKPKHVWL